MKKFLKRSIVAGAVMILAGSVYAIPTLVVSDGSGISSINTSASGAVTVTTSDSDWSVVVATGIASPPSVGQGTPSSPVMSLIIAATYIGNGTAGNPLTISFGADAFGPTSASVLATLNGHAISGTGGLVTFQNLAASGSVLPTLLNPVIAGTVLTSASLPGASTYTSSLIGGPLDLSSYSLDSVVTMTGVAGVTYSITASLVAVPDGGMTLVILGSALTSLALLKKKLF